MLEGDLGKDDFPEDDLETLKLFEEDYEYYLDSFSWFFKNFPFLEDYKKKWISFAKKGINLCKNEINGYLIKGEISDSFIIESNELTKKMIELNNKIEVQARNVLNFFNYGGKCLGEINPSRGYFQICPN